VTREDELLQAAAAHDCADVHLRLPEIGVRHREEYIRHQDELAPVSELHCTLTNTQ